MELDTLLTNPFLPSVLKHDFTTRGNEKYTLIKIEKNKQ